MNDIYFNVDGQLVSVSFELDAEVHLRLMHLRLDRTLLQFQLNFNEKWQLRDSHVGHYPTVDGKRLGRINRVPTAVT